MKGSGVWGSFLLGRQPALGQLASATPTPERRRPSPERERERVRARTYERAHERT